MESSDPSLIAFSSPSYKGNSTGLVVRVSHEQVLTHRYSCSDKNDNVCPTQRIECYSS